MKLIIITNLITPHQIPLCNEFYRLLDGRFTLVETMERGKHLPQGWLSDGDDLPYITSSVSKTAEELDNLIVEADCVIIGAAPMKYVQNRLKMNKLTFRYAERVYKVKPHWYEMPLRMLKYYFEFGRYQSLYLLCASGYTYPDYLRTHTFKGKAYKWGYFPYTKEYDIDSLLMDKNRKNLIKIMWAGRMLDWKHPEYAIEVAAYLNIKKYRFHMNVIGSGPMKPMIRQKILDYRLNDCVELFEEVTPSQIREYMEQADIFLFTSDRYEGWGATLNEAMNSGCAVVASHIIGAVPFLVNGENAMIFEDGNVDELCEKTEWLVRHRSERNTIGRKAYETIVCEWNSENAAQKFISLSQSLLSKKSREPYLDGVCSSADNIPDDWYGGKSNEKKNSNQLHGFL